MGGWPTDMASGESSTRKIRRRRERERKNEREARGKRERINPGFLAGSDQRRESPLYSGLGCCYMVMKGWDRVEYRKRERERESQQDPLREITPIRTSTVSLVCQSVIILVLVLISSMT